VVVRTISQSPVVEHSDTLFAAAMAQRAIVEDRRGQYRTNEEVTDWFSFSRLDDDVCGLLWGQGIRIPLNIYIDVA
jgi:hypothetical protein